MTKHQPNGGPALPSRDPKDVLQRLSHDIRAAMSDVVGGLRLMEPDRLDPQTVTQVQRVRAAADTLAGLIDDALLAAAGEASAASASSDLNLGDWIDALRQRWSGRAVERGGKFTVTTSGALPKQVRTARLVLERIVGNLVANALTHAPGSCVWVNLTGHSEIGLTIDVTDNGPGFPVEILDAMAANSRTKAMGEHRGSGLGLGIVRELCDELGASLEVQNKGPGGGGAVRLQIPASLLNWTGSGSAELPPPDLSGLRILVAEDNMTNQMILRQMLTDLGASIEVVGDGVAALDAFAEHTFDLALIDIEMPKLDGLQVMSRARSMGGVLARMPMVAITAYVLRDNREAIYAAGADGIIGKPIASGDEFGWTLMRYAGRRTGLPEPEDIAASGRASDMLATQMDFERLDALLEAAGPEGRVELLDRLSEDLSAVQSALAAGVASMDIPSIRSQTHILIAISGAVGADRLCQLSEVLNIAAKRKRVDQLEVLYGEVRHDLRDLIATVEVVRAKRPCA